MLVLPNDVRLLILDYLTLKRDLKALCGTSRACRELVLPQLYHDIYLITWDLQQARLKRFARCVAAGAGAHLRCTRSLTLEIVRPPSEPQSQLVGYTGIETILPPSNELYPAEQTDSFIMMLSGMFPSNMLRGFRYVCSRLYT
jgi:hypothetical protein